jgi:phosphoribosylformylglycinamidine synthase
VNSAVKRLYVEKKSGFDVEAHTFYCDLTEQLDIKSLKGVRVINRYDISGISEAAYAQDRNTIFSEPPVDNVYDEELAISPEERVFAMEYLPGQYDQRADSAMQCVQILTQKERPKIVTAKVIMLQGELSDEQFARIKAYYINPVESREATLDKPSSLEMEAETPEAVQMLAGFISKTAGELREFMEGMGLAMSFDDLRFCQGYFRDTEQRDPSHTEIKAIDTYWSDHCRHTTFFTKIEEVSIEQGEFAQPIAVAYQEYLKSRADVYGGKQEKDICLMDIAVMAMKELKQQGKLPDLDESEEINACSIVVNADVDGRSEEWLVMFKNETHNHPTEIEPFGGAATCLGGAIRDPLSGRSYVYQAMRVTGSGDPRTRIQDTLPGKLPQRTITTGAASGYSSYGNQIGLATGQVAEVYDQGFIAKRMEIGAVIAAAPRKNVVREIPCPGDVVILLGGKTGRDGCGGATGSSKEHTEESIFTCGAEVQKGNPPEERKIQRLFRNPAVSTLIKRCNDFGAGGVSVAVGELTDGLEINLDAIPKKYHGLDGTELAISESQERMAVVVAPENTERFMEFARLENLEATTVARVTQARRLVMRWRGQTIVDISREFLDTNGVKQTTQVKVTAPEHQQNYFKTIGAGAQQALPDLKAAWLANLQDLNVCSQKGMVERFDSTIGAGTVLMPFGGKYQATPSEGVVGKLPLLSGETTTGTVMTYGYNPKLAKWSPFHGALYAVVEAVAKVAAIGGNYQNVRLTLQEYFEKLGKESARWGKPFSALLGAYYAQKQLGTPAIGGKDSMSGTFKELNVPPTLVAFGVAALDVRQVVSPEFKQEHSQVVLVPLVRDQQELPDFIAFKHNLAKVAQLNQAGKLLAAQTVKMGGLAEAISKMCFGNKIGMIFNAPVEAEKLFSPDYGSFVLEMAAGEDLAFAFGDMDYQVLGHTQAKPVITVNAIEISLEEAVAAWEQPLERVFPTRTESIAEQPKVISFKVQHTLKPAVKVAKPRIFIPVFPGTNCEYDTARAFEKAGGVVETLVIRNLSAAEIEQSIADLVMGIKNSQIIMLPGGFSGGDEPDGSGKFIATAFRNPRVKEAVQELLQHRDGLMLGICNGFQALIKLGLVPYGEIREITEACPTLTHNAIARHVSCMVQTKVVSNLSPWFNNVEVGDVHTIAVSHGEGRFMANDQVIAQMTAAGQIATQYVDLAGNPTYDITYNPNGSRHAIEGITSPDGRVLGKMGHSERIGQHVVTNVPGSKDQQIFAAGIRYFQ